MSFYWSLNPAAAQSIPANDEVASSSGSIAARGISTASAAISGVAVRFIIPTLGAALRATYAAVLATFLRCSM